MIVYFSRSGKTEIIAQALAAITGLPLHTLASDIDGAKGFSFAWKALLSVVRVKGVAATNLPDTLPAEIYLCGPVWAGEPAGPLKFFIQQADLSRTRVHILLTARMPSEQHRTAARNLLERAGAQAGNIYLLATNKEAPDPALIKEHLQALLENA